MQTRGSKLAGPAHPTRTNRADGSFSIIYVSIAEYVFSDPAITLLVPDETKITGSLGFSRLICCNTFSVSGGKASDSDNRTLLIRNVFRSSIRVAILN